MLACDFLRCLCCKQGGMCAVCVCARVCLACLFGLLSGYAVCVCVVGREKGRNAAPRVNHIYQYINKGSAPTAGVNLIRQPQTSTIHVNHHSTAHISHTRHPRVNYACHLRHFTLKGQPIQRATDSEGNASDTNINGRQ